MDNETNRMVYVDVDSIPSYDVRKRVHKYFNTRGFKIDIALENQRVVMQLRQGNVPEFLHLCFIMTLSGEMRQIFS